MKRIFFVLCLAACCLSPLHADQPTPTTPEPEAAIAFPVQPDFATTTYYDIGDGIAKLCTATVSCGGGVTLTCSGSSCTSEAGRCVSCTSGGTTSKQFCQGTTGTTCNGTAVAIGHEGTSGVE